MKIKLLLFGIFTDIIGSDEIYLYDVNNTDELIHKLQNNYPGIKNVTYRIAVNREMINKNTLLKDSDEVALLPPFAGG